jgi:hypothetical protein
VGTTCSEAPDPPTFRLRSGDLCPWPFHLMGASSANARCEWNGHAA